MFWKQCGGKWRRKLGAIAAIAFLASTTNTAAARTVETPTHGDLQQAEYAHTFFSDDVTVYAETTAQIELARFGIQRYAAAGLDLPHVEIWMGDNPSDCIHPNTGDPSLGFATWRGDQAIVYHCGDRFVMLHELAHILDRHIVTEPMRTAFLELRGLEVWQDPTSWLASGEEHFADVLAWGLDEHTRSDVTTEPNDEASLETAYSFIRTAAAAVAPPR